jgi:hypothetical protein
LRQYVVEAERYEKLGDYLLKHLYEVAYGEKIEEDAK